MLQKKQVTSMSQQNSGYNCLT